MRRGPLRFFISTILLCIFPIVLDSMGKLESFMKPMWFGILCIFVLTFIIHMLVDLILIKLKIGKEDNKHVQRK